MSWPMAALFAASSIFGAIGEKKAGEAQAQEALAAARGAYLDMARIKQDLPRQVGQQTGAAAAMAAAMGALGSNNAYENIAQGVFETTLTAERELSDLETQATQLRVRARNARQAGNIRALSALLGGGAKAFSALGSSGAETPLRATQQPNSGRGSGGAAP